MIKKCGTWGGNRSVRLESQCKKVGIEIGDSVLVQVIDGKITIEKVITEFKVINGVKFSINE